MKHFILKFLLNITIILTALVIISCGDHKDELVKQDNGLIIQSPNSSNTVLLSEQQDTVFSYEPFTLDTLIIFNKDSLRIKIDKRPLKTSYIYIYGYSWYDNIVKLEIRMNSKVLFKADILKEDFSPDITAKEDLDESILSSFQYYDINDNSINFESWIGSPDSDVGELASYSVTFDGKVIMKLIEVQLGD